MAKRELADPIRAPSHQCAAASLVAQRLGLREPWYGVRRTTVPHLCRRRKRDCPRASRQPFSGPRPPTVTLCLAPPALNEFLSADDRPAWYYRSSSAWRTARPGARCHKHARTLSRRRRRHATTVAPHVYYAAAVDVLSSRARRQVTFSARPTAVYHRVHLPFFSVSPSTSHTHPSIAYQKT